MIIVGFDWARDKHDLCVLDPDGKIRYRGSVKHEAASLEQLRVQLADLEPVPANVCVAMEQHDGALLAWLLKTGYTVYGINPKSAERARDVFRPGGPKDDPGDALGAADLLRNNLLRYKPMHAQSVETLQLRSLSRLRARLTKQKTAQMQRLRTVLAEWCPSLSHMCTDFNRVWQRAFLKRWALHEDLAAAHGNSLNSFLSEHRLSADTRARVKEVRKQQPVFIPEGRKDALRIEIELILSQLELLIDRIAALDARLREAFVDHPSYETFNSLPVRGVATVSMIASAFGDRRDDPTGWRELGARWGVAPVTVRSGKSWKVKRRRACDTHVLQALNDFAFTTAFSVNDCWAREYYRKKRNEGHDHHETLRQLGLRWIKILWRIWHDGTTYNEQFHQHRRKHCEKQENAKTA